MDIKNLYFKLLKNNTHKPDRIQQLMEIGLSYELLRTRVFSKDPYALRYLNEFSLKLMKQAFEKPEESVWVNLFVPCEVMHAFGLKPISIEYFASFLAGFQLQNIYLDKANHLGLSDTLCSYHKAFIGAVESGIVSSPAFAVATSIICDANNSTFAYLTHKCDVPYFLLDIPHEKSKGAISYVYNQLMEMIEHIEKATHRKFDIKVLRTCIQAENKTLNYVRESLPLLRERLYSKTMTHEMYMLNMAYIYMGSPEALHFYKSMYNELEKEPKGKKKRLLWIHTMPFPFEPFKKIFSQDSPFDVVAMELNCPETSSLDEENPLKALSEKMIDNIYNGSYERKIKKIMDLAEVLKVDGIIQFCHLGCRQNAGGTVLLKESLREKDIPFLSIEGDGLDMRNNQQGQLITRVEAFLEMIK